MAADAARAARESTKWPRTSHVRVENGRSCATCQNIRKGNGRPISSKPPSQKAKLPVQKIILALDTASEKIEDGS